MNKYYTPDIKEFRVGFEFEKFIHPIVEIKDLCQTEEQQSKGCWEPCSKLTDPFLGFIPKLSEKHYPRIAKANFRVKHLDKQDIESLGFEFVENDGYFLIFSKDHDKYSNYDICLREDDNFLCIEYRYQCHLTARAEDVKSRSSECLFKGIIKNKSVFKEVLEMLRINK